MRFITKTLKKSIGLSAIVIMLIGMMTASALQVSAASPAGSFSVSESAKALINGYVSDTVFGVLIFVIILLVLALVAVVVVMFVILNKKKDHNNPTPNPTPYPAPTNAQSLYHAQPMDQSMNRAMNQPMGQPVNRPMNQPMYQPMNRPVNEPAFRPQAPVNFAQDDSSDKTQLLADGGGDTTVLGEDFVGFTLMRKNGSEKIVINKPEFYIGKERAKVDYCITNNNSVSRRHAKFKVRSGKCYISDLGSTNCTYINGAKLSPNQEVALIPGDKVRLSNEEFEFIG